jgi:O-antigen/teichoic acid export membrane protein
MKKEFKNVSWVLYDQIAVIVSLGINILILTKLFSPLDFGVYAIGMIIIGIVQQVFALGFSAALIQFENHNKYYGSAWSFNLTIAFTLTVLLVLFIPSILNVFFKSFLDYSYYFQLLSSCILITGLGNVGVIELFRSRDTKRIFLIRGFLELLKVIIIYWFFTIFGDYRALIYAFLLISVIKLCLSYIIAPIKVKFDFNLKLIKELFSFSGWLQLKNIGKVIVNQLDSILIASLLTPLTLGFYSRSIAISKVPEKLFASFNEMFVFSYISEHRKNKSRVSFVFDIYILSLLLINGVICIVFYFFGEKVIELILGTKWIEISKPLFILLLSMSFNAMSYLFFPFLRALGFPKLEFKLFMYKLVILLIISYPLVLNYGILGAASANLISALVTMPIVIENTKNILGNSVRKTYFLVVIWFSVALIWGLIYSYNYEGVFDLIMNMIFLIFVYCISGIIVTLIVYPKTRNKFRELIKTIRR